MKVLVTGGHGLVGTALQQEVTKSSSVCEYYFVSRSECDFRHYNQVEQVFAHVQPDVVVHLCARVGGVYDNMNKNFTYLMDNMEINNNVVNACYAFKVKKLVNILSTCIFPDDGVFYPLTSEQLHNGLPHFSNIGYAFSKRLLHVASKLLTDASNIQVVNLIPTNLYGENDNYNIESGHVLPALVHKMFIAVQTGSALHVKGNGLAVRQFLYAGDLARVIMAFVTNSFTQKEVTCIVSPPADCEISIQEIVDKLKMCFNWSGEVVYEPFIPSGQYKKTTSDYELKLWMPDFSFTSLDVGMQNVVRFFVENYQTVRK